MARMSSTNDTEESVKVMASSWTWRMENIENAGTSRMSNIATLKTAMNNLSRKAQIKVKREYVIKACMVCWIPPDNKTGCASAHPV